MEKIIPFYPHLSGFTLVTKEKSINITHFLYSPVQLGLLFTKTFDGFAY